MLWQASTSQLRLSNCSGGSNLSASEFQLELSAVEMVRVSSCWQASLVSFAHYPAPSAVHRLSGFSITLLICHRWFFFALCVHIFSGCLTVTWHQPLRKWNFLPEIMCYFWALPPDSRRRNTSSNNSGLTNILAIRQTKGLLCTNFSTQKTLHFIMQYYNAHPSFLSLLIVDMQQPFSHLFCFSSGLLFLFLYFL